MRLPGFLKRLTRFGRHSKQTTFCYCDCGYELCGGNSLVEDSEEMVTYLCKNCGKITRWYFNAPAPIKTREPYGLSCSCGNKDLNRGVKLSGKIAWSYCEQCDRTSKFRLDGCSARPLERRRGRIKE